MSKIKAGTTTTTAYQVEADTTGTLVLQTGSTPTTALTIGTDQSTTLAGNLNVAGQNMTPYTGFKNRIINGDMRIDQRNAGASVTVNDAGVYTLDRWYGFDFTGGSYTVQQSTDAPAGFINSLKVTVTSAATPNAGDPAYISQQIEGLNVADLGWGTADAQSVTISFRVKSSLTGTFGGAVSNSAGNRSYAFTFSISAANTWETKTITIAGDTSGTWLKTNGVGIKLDFNIGTGSTYTGAAGAWAGTLYLSATGSTNLISTNGATFYITGVQLEKGSTATSFDYRPYGTELQLCQRYYFKINGNDGYSPVGTGTAYLSTTAGRIQIPFPVPMRGVPTPSFGGTIQVVGNTAASGGFTLGTTYGGKLGLMQDISWTGAMSAAGVGLFVYTYPTSSDYFQCSAEL